MNRDKVRRMACRAFDQLVKSVEAGKSQKLIEYLKAMGRFHQYSVGNAILIGFQKPGATHVAGFRMWQRLGRRVKKGEHGIAIMAPIVYRRKIEPEESDEKETGDETVRTFKTVHVFDVSQTDGKPLPEFAMVRGDPRQFLDRLNEFAAAKRILVKHTLMTAEGASAGGMILLKQSLKPAEEFSVLCHELAHEILHRDPNDTPKDKKVRETEAEAVAFVVCHGVGLDVSSASSDYIQLYDGDRKTLLESLERIQRTAAEILGAITEEGKLRVETGRESVPAVAAA
jgi:antirestriction protein ArdC